LFLIQQILSFFFISLVERKTDDPVDRLRELKEWRAKRPSNSISQEKDSIIKRARRIPIQSDFNEVYGPKTGNSLKNIRYEYNLMCLMGSFAIDSNFFFNAH